MSNNIDLDDVRLLLQWVDDVESGEIIETHNYTGSYFGFSLISEHELNLLCNTINPILKRLGHKTRIHWVAGEIRPTSDKKRVKIIDNDICPGICRVWQRTDCKGNEA